MLTSLTIDNAALVTSVIVNEFSGTLHYPVHRFVWDQPSRGDDLPKMEQAGRHDRYSDIDVMALTMEGHFLSDNTTQYWQIRNALLSVVIPFNDHLYRWHSRIRMKVDGDAETYWCYVVLMDYDAPLEANYPTVTPFQFQWENEYGYWRKLSDNSIAFI